ncbi:hypothetical protein OAM92_00390 [Acidimicrobiales bacterium]|nr:hypothetical protein [Acidimicrobiales bacterium]
MAESSEEWDRYKRWNIAIADVVYPVSEAGIPVYLDLEDDVLAAIAAIAEPNVSEPGEALVEAVKATLTFGRGPGKVLRQHLINLDSWWSDADTAEPPPTLALVAVFSLAAENMHDGEGKAANNYYDRLRQLLKISRDDLDTLQKAYRFQYDGMAVSTYLWTSLNDWLEYLEGNRGLPTAIASATGHAHIGFPLSQALVRATDRERFIEMFAAYGLPPGGSLPPSEMAQLLTDWMSMVPCPATNNLERVWNREVAARERIVDVARLCLESWDGTGVDDVAVPAGAGRPDLVRVRAQLRSFPGPEIEVTLVLPARVEQEVETLEVLDKDERVIGELDLVGAASGWMTLADPSEVSPGSLLGGLVSFRREGRPSPLGRRPRRLIPMRYDDLMQAYIEVERVQLGEDSMLLARSEIAPVVTNLLENAARPGFNRIEVLPGLPPGWVLFKHVQILSSIPESELRNKLVDLHVLQPLAVSYCAFQGGDAAPWPPSEVVDCRATRTTRVDGLGL